MTEDKFARLRRSGIAIAKAICAALGERRITPDEACYGVAHDVAVGLQLINEYLTSLPPYWIEPDVEELCHTLLLDLLDITKVRGCPFILSHRNPLPGRPFNARPQNTSAIDRRAVAVSKRVVIPLLDNNWGAWWLAGCDDAHRCVPQPPKRPPNHALFPRLPLFSFSSGRSETPDLETRVLNFFRANAAKARKLKSTCDELRVKLTENDAENDLQQIPENALKQLNDADMSAYFNGGVFNALELASTCQPQSHENTVELPWHPARLCLDETEGGIRVLVSPSIETGDWQEFCVRTR
jgi:hypothetical protein